MLVVLDFDCWLFVVSLLVVVCYCLCEFVACCLLDRLGLIVAWLLLVVCFDMLCLGCFGVCVTIGFGVL